MTEQELRDYVHMRSVEYCGETALKYYAQIVLLDEDTLALRILQMDHKTVAYNWKIATYTQALSVLAWADNGGNWTEEE